MVSGRKSAHRGDLSYPKGISNQSGDWTSSSSGFRWDLPYILAWKNLYLATHWCSVGFLLLDAGFWQGDSALWGPSVTGWEAAGGWAGFVGGVFVFLLECAHIPCLWSSPGRTLASSGRCSVPCVAGHTWPGEIRALFFPRPRWGRAEIRPFPASAWPPKAGPSSAVSCYDTKETFVCH